MVKYCLAIFFGMMLTYFIGTSCYDRGYQEGIKHEKFQHLDNNKQYKSFLEGSDIPDNYTVAPIRPEYKL